MTKSNLNPENPTKQKPFDQNETQPDMKGDKVWHSSVDKTKNNKPKVNK